jgi:hypothetical protein
LKLVGNKLKLFDYAGVNNVILKKVVQRNKKNLKKTIRNEKFVIMENS